MVPARAEVVRVEGPLRAGVVHRTSGASGHFTVVVQTSWRFGEDGILTIVAPDLPSEPTYPTWRDSRAGAEIVCAGRASRPARAQDAPFTAGLTLTRGKELLLDRRDEVTLAASEPSREWHLGRSDSAEPAVAIAAHLTGGETLVLHHLDPSVPQITQSFPRLRVTATASVGERSVVLELSGDLLAVDATARTAELLWSADFEPPGAVDPSSVRWLVQLRWVDGAPRRSVVSADDRPVKSAPKPLPSHSTLVLGEDMRAAVRAGATLPFQASSKEPLPPPPPRRTAKAAPAIDAGSTVQLGVSAQQLAALRAATPFAPATGGTAAPEGAPRPPHVTETTAVLSLTDAQRAALQQATPFQIGAPAHPPPPTPYSRDDAGSTLSIPHGSSVVWPFLSDPSTRPTATSAAAPPSTVKAASPSPTAPLADLAGVRVDRFGAITAELDEPGAARDAVLAAHGLTAEQWEDACRAWTQWEDDERPEAAFQCDQVDEAYVARREQITAQPFGLEHLARLERAERAGGLLGAIGDLAIPLGALLRLRRVWQRRVEASTELRSALDRLLRG